MKYNLFLDELSNVILLNKVQELFIRIKCGLCSEKQITENLDLLKRIKFYMIFDTEYFFKPNIAYETNVDLELRKEKLIKYTAIFKYLHFIDSKSKFSFFPKEEQENVMFNLGIYTSIESKKDIITPFFLVKTEKIKVFDQIFYDIDSKIRIKNLSAPTSFGKSWKIIEESIIRFQNGGVSVIIVPTVALQNEYFFNFLKSFGVFKIQKNEIKISTNINDSTEDSNIFILTPERTLNLIAEYESSIKVDTFFIDEAHSLNNIIDERATKIRRIVAFAYKREINIRFFSPSSPDFFDKFISTKKYSEKNYVIESIPTYKEYVFSSTNSYKYLKFSSIFTNNKKEEKDFNTIEFKKQDFLYNDEKTLFYCKKWKIHEEISNYLINCFSGESNLFYNDELMKIVDIKYGKNYKLYSYLKRGVAYHHGDLDFLVKMYIESEFKNDKSQINKLFCTTTLIEGVNLNSNNLVVRDLEIENLTNISFNKFIYLNNFFGRIGRINSMEPGFILIKDNEKNELIEETLNIQLGNNKALVEIQDQFNQLKPKQREKIELYLSDKKNKSEKSYDILSSEYPKKNKITDGDYLVNKSVYKNIGNFSKDEMININKKISDIFVYNNEESFYANIMYLISTLTNKYCKFTSLKGSWKKNESKKNWIKYFSGEKYDFQYNINLEIIKHSLNKLSPKIIFEIICDKYFKDNREIILVRNTYNSKIQIWHSEIGYKVSPFWIKIDISDEQNFTTTFIDYIVKFKENDFKYSLMNYLNSYIINVIEFTSDNEILSMYKELKNDMNNFEEIGIPEWLKAINVISEIKLEIVSLVNSTKEIKINIENKEEVLKFLEQNSKLIYKMITQ